MAIPGSPRSRAAAGTEPAADEGRALIVTAVDDVLVMLGLDTAGCTASCRWAGRSSSSATCTPDPPQSKGGWSRCEPTGRARSTTLVRPRSADRRATIAAMAAARLERDGWMIDAGGWLEARGSRLRLSRPNTVAAMAESATPGVSATSCTPTRRLSERTLCRLRDRCPPVPRVGRRGHSIYAPAAGQRAPWFAGTSPSSRPASSRGAASPARPPRCGATSPGQSTSVRSTIDPTIGLHVSAGTGQLPRVLDRPAIAAARWANRRRRTRVAATARRCRARNPVRLGRARLRAVLAATRADQARRTCADRVGQGLQRAAGAARRAVRSSVAGVAGNSPRGGADRGRCGGVRQRARKPADTA